MRKKTIRTVLLAAAVAVGAYVIHKMKVYQPYIPEQPAKIFLYGEEHGKKEMLQKELNLWKERYHKENKRALFVELPYYTAQELNLWMNEQDDKRLEQIYEDWYGTLLYVPDVKEFYKEVKETCPETVFYGTDVGHQYDTIGKRHLEYLRNNGKEDTKEYQLTIENINQGQQFYQTESDGYREAKMVENFIQAYDQLEDKTIMGIYGDDHCDPRKETSVHGVDSMAKQLKEHYGDTIQYEFVKELQ